MGAAIAKTCASYGAKIIVHYNGNKNAADAVCKDIGKNAIACIQEDLSKTGAGTRLWAQAVSQVGPINALVNNAGIDMVSDLYGGEAEWANAWEQIMAVNMQAPADLSRAALRDFRKMGEGRIVNVCSRASHRGDSIDHAAYAASKGGLLALSKTLARGAAKDGVLVYALAPGWINTEMAPTDPEVLRSALAEIPFGKFAEPEEIGALTAFLLSDLCPSATAATIDVNGASHVR
ncbi:MAG: SDR family oxidoreductase [Robiginitomaculum sp.]|nr:SDR family oxidoreductase [Robiginitomaculum sp.]